MRVYVCPSRQLALVAWHTAAPASYRKEREQQYAIETVQPRLHHSPALCRSEGTAVMDTSLDPLSQWYFSWATVDLCGGWSSYKVCFLEDAWPTMSAPFKGSVPRCAKIVFESKGQKSCLISLLRRKHRPHCGHDSDLGPLTLNDAVLTEKGKPRLPLYLLTVSLS